MGLFGKKKEKKPKFIDKSQTQQVTYEVYKGSGAESARVFLKEKRVNEKQYYIVVETPEGNWGLDIKGLYLEKLLPFQSNISIAKCEGSTTGMPDIFSLQMAAKKINDNFICNVKCGKCDHVWLDGLRY